MGGVGVGEGGGFGGGGLEVSPGWSGLLIFPASPVWVSGCMSSWTDGGWIDTR